MILQELADKLPGKDIGTINEYIFKDDIVTWNVKDWEDNGHIESVSLRLISRKDALTILNIKGDTARIRNYEIEESLHERFDIGYFIEEICPINGFSTYS